MNKQSRSNIFGTKLSLIALASVAIFSLPRVSGQAEPDPPNDLTRVYYLNSERRLTPLPFESGLNLPNVFVPAAKDKLTNIQLRDAAAGTTITNDEARFYVFVGERMDPPPHQLVRLAQRRGMREITISQLQGRKGYAPFARDNIKLANRLLRRLEVQAGPGRVIYVNYMQLQPVERLKPGEYAIIGDSLADIATFRIR